MNEQDWYDPIITHTQGRYVECGWRKHSALQISDKSSHLPSLHTQMCLCIYICITHRTNTFYCTALAQIPGYLHFSARKMDRRHKLHLGAGTLALSCMNLQG